MRYRGARLGWGSRVGAVFAPVCVSSWQWLCLPSACGIPEPPHTLLCPAFLWLTNVTGESVGKTEASRPKNATMETMKRIKTEEGWGHQLCPGERR